MRSLTVIIVLITLGVSACTCKSTICTDDFKMVMVQAENANGSPAVLDEVYTIRKSTGEKIIYSQGMGSGYYLVLDDTYQSKLRNSDDLFTLVGMSGGKKIVEEVYHIAAGPCHIEKRSGKEKVVVN